LVHHLNRLRQRHFGLAFAEYGCRGPVFRLCMGPASEGSHHPRLRRCNPSNTPQPLWPLRFPSVCNHPPPSVSLCGACRSHSKVVSMAPCFPQLQQACNQRCRSSRKEQFTVLPGGPRNFFLDAQGRSKTSLSFQPHPVMISRVMPPPSHRWGG